MLRAPASAAPPRPAPPRPAPPRPAVPCPAPRDAHKGCPQTLGGGLYGRLAGFFGVLGLLGPRVAQLCGLEALGGGLYGRLAGEGYGYGYGYGLSLSRSQSAICSLIGSSSIAIECRFPSTLR
ncbi:hypothetical protein GCM10027057_21840 [Marisediminicola antarctica]